jgi:hypothetical protein
MTELAQSETTVSSPSSEEIVQAGAPPPVSDEHKAGLDAGLNLMSREEEIDSYVEERKDQDDYLAGKKLDTDRTAAWNKRAHEAVQKASQQVSDARGAHEAKQFETGAIEHGTDPSYFPGDQVEIMMERARQEGAARVRAAQYFGGEDNERITNALNWHEALDPDRKVRAYYTNSPVGPEMAEYNAENPEYLGKLAEMDPQQRHDTIKQLEGFLVARRQFSGQQQPNQFAPRRVSSAPPVMKAVKGGANPQSDLHTLASRSESVGDYVRARHQLDKQPRD